MKEKILEKIREWHKIKEIQSQIDIPDELLDLVIDKTAEAIFDEIKNEFSEEFEKGNLKQPFFISDEYYIYLKLKEIKNSILKNENQNQDNIKINYYTDIKEKIED